MNAMKRTVMLVAAVVLGLAMTSVVQGRPDYGISCASCHSSIVTGKMEVTGEDTVVDLGTQLNGQRNGPLKTYLVNPGETVTLSANVLDGSSKYAVQLSRLSKGGQENATANRMNWSRDGSIGGVWNKYGTTANPYFTTNAIGNGATGVRSFGLAVGASTPADTYDLIFAMAGTGGGLWYQEEHFYVRVAAAATSLSLSSPNGGESLTAGQTYAITWQSTGAISGILIEYSSNNGLAWNQVAANASNTGSYNWLVPQVTSGQCLVRISGGGNTAVSAGTFAITQLISPTISGYVETSDATAIQDVPVSSDNGGGSDTTDASGYYSIIVPYGWSGTVTPGSAYYTFNPPSQTYSNVTADQSNQDYTGSLAPYNLADHVFGIEVFEVLDYNGPANPNDLTYVFYYAIETDETVDLVEVLTPAGSTFQVPKQAHTQAGNIETWYNYDGTSYLWEYEAQFADAGGLDNYGDGTYTVTVHYGGISQAVTTLWFGVPGSNSAIPQPRQEPILTFPENNAQTTSPVTFTWEACSDPNAASIRLGLEAVNNNQVMEFDFPTDAIQSDPAALSSGNWQAMLSFDHLYDTNNADGISARVGKYSESDYEFSTGKSGQITVTAPNDTDQWMRGKKYRIRWTGAGPKAEIRVKLFKGASSVATLKSATVNDGVCTWTIPHGQSLGDNYRVKVISLKDTSNYGFSDYFSIVRNSIVVSSPNGSEEWLRGEQYRIRWTGGRADSGVKVKLFKGSSAVRTLKSSTPNDGVCAWTVPQGLPLGDDYRIKVILLKDRSNSDLSDGYFKIVDSLSPPEPEPDTTAPTPDPLTWASVPAATGSSSISMTATTASDASGVEYYFECISGGGNDSGWQDSPVCEDTGLSANTQYTYRVMARDKSPNQNQTGWTSSASATTEADETDVITIITAEYLVDAKELKVRATSSEQPAAILTVEGYGVMTWNGDGNRYEFKAKPAADPGALLTVTSSLGGSVTVSVDHKDDDDPSQTLTIKKAEYKVGDQEFRVEANSSDQPTAVLTVEGYGVMTWNSEKNKYEYRVKPVADPGSLVTVTSSSGESVTVSITHTDGSDAITITKAEYNLSNQELRVQAKSFGQPNETLTLKGYGVLTWKSDKNKYEYRVKSVSDPGGSVTVTSGSGKSAIKSVKYKEGKK
ncbi:MAG: Ser-Thr-rich GPI-anchored membrane family protein [Planctomycetota bacterium]